MCAHHRPSNATYIWTQPDSSGRNQVALFRRSFELTEEPAHATLHLFADTRYRLTVNGIIVGHGPARFKKGFPEYDSHDIARCCKMAKTSSL